MLFAHSYLPTATLNTFLGKSSQPCSVFAKAIRLKTSEEIEPGFVHFVSVFDDLTQRQYLAIGFHTLGRGLNLNDWIL